MRWGKAQNYHTFLTIGAQTLGTQPYNFYPGPVPPEGPGPSEP